jgi:acyl carrier protein
MRWSGDAGGCTIAADLDRILAFPEATMTHQELFDNIQDVFRNVFDDPTLLIAREMTAEDVQGWDSFAHVNLIMALEATFAVKFRLAEVQELQCVGDIVDVIGKKAGVTT